VPRPETFDRDLLITARPRYSDIEFARNRRERRTLGESSRDLLAFEELELVPRRPST
jgi:hypothetical protein